MAKSKHYGAFAKGFADSMLAVMKLKMMQDYYEGRNANAAQLNEYKRAYWASKGLTGQRGKDAEIQGWEKTGRDLYGGANVNQSDAPTPGGGGYVSMQDMVKLAQNAGFKGDDAAHMAALAYAESQGHVGAVGKSGEIGLTQINPHAWGAMADQARTPQGAFDAAKVVYDKQGWGAWSTDPSSANFTPGNSGMRFVDAARKFLPTTETAAATPTKGPNKGKEPTKVAAADVPAPEVEPKSEMEGGAGGGFRIPETGKVVDAPTTPSSVLPAPGAAQPNEVAGLPRYGTGPTDTGDPSGRMIPPAGGAPSMGYPALAPGPANVAPSPQPPPEERNMPYPGQADPKGVYAPSAVATDTGARPDLTARSPATEANKPAPEAEPVSATRAIPSNPQGNSRYVMIDRPNADPTQRNRGSPQGTAIDLSHLWGPNPPLDQRAPTPAPTPPPRPRDDDWSSVASAPNMNDVSAGIQLGAAKGGAIRRYGLGGDITQGVQQPSSEPDFVGGDERDYVNKANPPSPPPALAYPGDAKNITTHVHPLRGALPARPTLKLQGGGMAQSGAGGAYNSAPPTQPTALTYGTWNSPTSTAYVPPASQPIMGVNPHQLAVPNPDASMSGYQPWTRTETMKASDPSLTPDQQAWYQQQIANSQSQNGSYYYNPASMPTGATAAAPSATPAIAPAPAAMPAQPSVQNITNYPAAYSDPTATTVTGAQNIPNIVTAKSYDPNVDAQTGAGFANTNNIGGTNYSVGTDDLLKQTSPGQISGGNSTILSRKGGPITRRVTGYDDGGGVSPSIAGMPPGLGGQAPIPPIYYNPATYAAAGAPVGKGISAASAPTFGAGAIPSLPMAHGGVVGFADGGGVDDDMATMAYMDRADDQPDPGSDAIEKDIEASNQPPAPVPTGGEPPVRDTAEYASLMPTSGPTTAPTQSGPPPGVPDTTPEVKDDNGNPSKGFIAALTSGMHWLGEHLGIGGAQAAPAIASHPETQARRASFASGQNVGDMTPEAREAINNAADPNHDLPAEFRNMAGMEYAYKQLISLGRDGDAAKMAGAILHYDQQVSVNHAEEAAKLLYDGHHAEAVDEINKASDALTDGRRIHATLLKNGDIQIDGSDLNGRQIWQQIAAPRALLGELHKMRNGSMQWDAYESQAAKYDDTYRQMGKARAANITRRQKEADDTAAQGQANEQIAALGPQFDTGEQPAPTETAPTAAPTTPAVPGPGAPTMTADSNAPVTRGVTGHGAIPPPPDQADRPAPDVQPVDLEHDAGYQNIVAQTTPKYFTTDGRPLVGGKPMNRPPTINQVTLKSYAPQVKAAYNERWRQYTEAVQQNQAAMRQDIDGQRRDYTADITSKRTAQTQEHADTAADTRAERQGQRDAILNQQRAALEEHNATYTDQMKREMPRSDADVHELQADVSGSSFVPLARALIPDQSEATDDKASRTALAAAGYDPGMQRTMKQAFDNGLRYSSLSSRDEVAAGVGQLASGKEGKGSYDKRTDTYNISVANDDGSVSRITLPASDAINLQKMGYKFATASAIKNAGDVEARPSGPGMGTPAIPSMQDWQTRSPAEQTQQPPM